MSRYIDADKLKHEIHCLYSDDLGIIEHIDNAPSADVVEVKRGKWLNCKGENALIYIRTDKTGKRWIYPFDARCSECGEWLDASDEYDVCGNFCPFCGARMDGDT